MSEGAVLKIETSFVCVACTCGLVFAVPADVRKRWRETGNIFVCPMGHSLSYKESEIERLQKQLTEAQEKAQAAIKRKEWAENAARQQRDRADKAERSKARLQKRVKNGVCPCCHRTVSQLARHMKSKHPEYGDSAP